MAVPSATQVNRAGELLRQWWLAPGPGVWTPEHDEALGLLVVYRTLFQVPLTSVVMSLRSFMRSERVPVVVAQRLKRMPTITGKLGRLPEMQLARMQDVGGCRAIVPAGYDTISGMRRRLHGSVNEVVREYDYIANPKATGYRAVHVVVRRGGRLIEIQLRTAGQHRWAEAVETAQAITGFPLKDGEGPPQLLRYYELAGHAVAAQDEHRQLDTQLQADLVASLEIARPYFVRQ